MYGSEVSLFLLISPNAKCQMPTRHPPAAHPQSWTRQTERPVWMSALWFNYGSPMIPKRMDLAPTKPSRMLLASSLKAMIMNRRFSVVLVFAILAQDIFIGASSTFPSQRHRSLTLMTLRGGSSDIPLSCGSSPNEKQRPRYRLPGPSSFRRQIHADSNIPGTRSLPFQRNLPNRGTIVSLNKTQDNHVWK